MKDKEKKTNGDTPDVATKMQALHDATSPEKQRAFLIAAREFLPHGSFEQLVKAVQKKSPDVKKSQIANFYHGSVENDLYGVLPVLGEMVLKTLKERKELLATFHHFENELVQIEQLMNDLEKSPQRTKQDFDSFAKKTRDFCQKYKQMQGFSKVVESVEAAIAHT